MKLIVVTIYPYPPLKDTNILAKNKLEKDSSWLEPLPSRFFRLLTGFLDLYKNWPIDLVPNWVN